MSMTSICTARLRRAKLVLAIAAWISVTGAFESERDPVALAAWVLRDNPEWGTDRIIAAMNGHGTFRVNLAKPFPVFVLYNTAIVTESGEVHFFDDVYGQDAILEQALARGYPYSKNDG